MEQATFVELARSVQRLGNSQTIRDALDIGKVIFDGSSADTFAKWLAMMEEVCDKLEHDDVRIIKAASLTLKSTNLGTPLE